MVQSAAALAAQNSTSLHEEAQRDSAWLEAAERGPAQHDSAQLEASKRNSAHCGSPVLKAAQHDSAQRYSEQLEAVEHESGQAEAAKPDQLHSQHLGSSAEHNNLHSTAEPQHAVLSNQQNSSHTSDAADLESMVPAQQRLSDKVLPKQARQPIQAEPHATGGHQHAAVGGEEEGDDEGLFAEASVLARGGLKATEKASHVAYAQLARSLQKESRRNR